MRSARTSRDLLQKRKGRVVMRLAAGAMVSSWISTLIGIFSRKIFGEDESHLLFIAAVAMIWLLLGSTRFALRQVDAGFVFVLILFEPIGPVLLHHESAPPGLILTLLLGFAVACLFGHEETDGSQSNRL